MNFNSRTTTLLSLMLLASIGACSKPVETKPPERLVQITVATAKATDLAVVESATGSETALGFALDYDPTRVAGKTFYVRLSFPEQVALQLRVGQAVQLSSFADDSRSAQGTIREIRPSLSATTLSREVIVAVRDASWRPSGSVRGEVTLGVHRNAVVVPEQAVVLRATGTVVYVIENGVAHERPIKSGITNDGMMEITTGLPAGASVAVDGAALLADGVKISVREPTAPVDAKNGGKAS